MASALCSSYHHHHHHHRSYNNRRLRASPSNHARPRSSTGGLTGSEATGYLYYRPMSTSRGNPVSCSSMEASKRKQGPDHLLILVHGIMASPSDWTYGEAVLKKRLGDNIFIYGMCEFELYIHLVNFKDDSPAASSSSLLLLRYNDLKLGAGCAEIELNAHKKEHTSKEMKLAPAVLTYAHRLTVDKKVIRHRRTNYFFAASSSNIYTKSFDGIDVAGRRLAKEVLDVVQKMAGLKKISFIAHSLGGLFSRYAISILYSLKSKETGSSANVMPTIEGSETSRLTPGLGTVAGLEPINFITLATPHLGVRGKNQLPFLQGLSFLEKLAAPLAPFIVGRTGAQLFLTDGEPSKPPLLLLMTSDHEDKKFLSALAAFKNRILYANVSYDHMVGWKTSSIRREVELRKPLHRSVGGYKHIVNVEYCSPVSSGGPHFPSRAAKAKEAAQSRPNNENTEEYHKIMEEEMIHGLQRVGWKKVDVNFHASLWPYFAHNNIHVKSEWLHNAGAGVIAHIADSIKQTCLHANL